MILLEDPKGSKTNDHGTPSMEELPVKVEPRKPNRHERRKREKLARLITKREALEVLQRKQ